MVSVLVILKEKAAHKLGGNHPQAVAPLSNSIEEGCHSLR